MITTPAEQTIRNYRAAFISAFGADPPKLKPDGKQFVMTDDTFPSFPSVFSVNEINDFVEKMEVRIADKLRRVIPQKSKMTH